MDYEITAPDGRKYRITAPEGATQEQVLSYAQSQWERRGKGVGEMPKMDPTEGMGVLDKFRAGVGKGMSDLVVGAGQRLGMVDQGEVDERAKRDSSLMDTTSGAIGNVTGRVALSLPTMAIPGVNTLAGATAVGGGMGLLEPTKTGESVGGNVALSAAGGAIGKGVGNLLSRAIQPVQSQLNPQMSALAQSAQQRGIPLDAADLTGSRPLTTLRDVLAQMPLTADRQAAIQGAKQTAFNRAVSATYGGADDAITPQALQAARSRLGQQFTDLSARNTLQANQGLVTSLGGIQQQVNRYATPDVARIVNNNIDDILGKIEPGDIITGRAYRELDSQIGRLARNSSSGDVRNYLGQVRETLRNAMDQSISQADRQAWQQARGQYANLMKVAPLAAKDEAGDVSGRSLLAAAVRGGNAFNGGRELGELGRIGRAFVAEQTPNSGTAQRTLYQNMLKNPIDAIWQGASGGIGIPVQAAMNSRAGTRYLSQGLLPMTEERRMLVNAITRSGGAALPLVEGQ